VQDEIDETAQNSIEVTDRDTGQTLGPLSKTYDPTTRTATFTFNGLVPSGRYQATLRGDTFYDAAQVQLDGDADGRAGGDYAYHFFYLTADVNHDASVDFTDLLTLAQRYGSPNATFAEGDVNYDGSVNFNDLLLLAQNYGKGLAARAATPAQVAAASAPDPLSTGDSPLRRLKRTRTAGLARTV
jgi:hypothetical protein